MLRLLVTVLLVALALPGTAWCELSCLGEVEGPVSTVAGHCESHEDDEAPLDREPTPVCDDCLEHPGEDHQILDARPSSAATELTTIASRETTRDALGHRTRLCGRILDRKPWPPTTFRTPPLLI